jgi:hypothetical protein
VHFNSFYTCEMCNFRMLKILAVLWKKLAVLISTSMSRGLRPLPFSLRNTKACTKLSFFQKTIKTKKTKKQRKNCSIFLGMVQLKTTLYIYHLMAFFERLFHGLQIYMRHKFFVALDTKIQSFFVPNTNVNFLVMDPDNLIFFRKGREHYLSLFLLHCLLLYFRKINFGTWSQGTDFSKSDQKIQTLTSCT